jgi:hypothetical protein
MNAVSYNPWTMTEPQIPASELRKRLRWFLDSFDGSQDVAYVEVPQPEPRPKEVPAFIPIEPPLWSQSPVFDSSVSEEDVADELGDLHQDLQLLLGRGFADGSDTIASFGLRSSLRFGVRGGYAAKPPKGSTGYRRKWRELNTAPGVWVMVVDGRLKHLVPYLVAHLLTMSGMVALTRCQAPLPYSFGKRPCGRLLIQHGQGRPRRFCDDACRKNADHAKDMRVVWERKERAHLRKRRRK